MPSPAPSLHQPHPHPDTFAQLAQSRRSVRAFLPTPVPDGLLHSVLQSARLAPSGANLQPGSFVAVQGQARAALSAELVQCFRAGQQEVEDYAYFPRPLPGVLRRRQVAAARALYGALGIAREDAAARAAQFERNFCFFDAPVALVVTIDHRFGNGGYMDLGMALYGLMLAAEAKGLASCAIGALACYPSLIRRHLGQDEQSHIVCGLALGYADAAAPVNQTRTTRCPLEDYFRVVG